MKDETLIQLITIFMTIYVSIYAEYKDICGKPSLSQPVDCLVEYSSYDLKF